ncbi:hypothetical protein [Roseobacter sp. TSBP12]|uniref:hypothetical protein n=1 Tax=Roseobacter sp. TSBP12 TaxID=1236613 RepID=UPI00126007EC|nr:hypothetical protein [Roseobacter sp. TSBP12]KAB6714317.1 hypothetical protein C8029_21495 [Roseobacter sp. TSBP12]
MDSAEQAIGEKRVRSVLIDPLLRRGLAKPGSLTKAQFDDMLGDLCARLAYMSDANLAALEEEAASKPGGKDRDRFPIANGVLDWAYKYQKPDDSGSPLIRRVFAEPFADQAIREGWAPELLKYLRDKRQWPKSYSIKIIRDEASDKIRRMQVIERQMRDGVQVTQSDMTFYQHRVSEIAKCEKIAALGRVEAAQ